METEGIDFRKKVWRELQKVPYGRTRTYKGIAEEIGHPRAFRAVGPANNRHPIAVIIQAFG
ncbi:MAG: methylated-DNA--[protein]-cysteine S-methyltransferase [Firmicutes bacterium]|nr:methylated-DNA--[protein]-cysteine S-methyltransferase [Bacillota bacterium]